LLNVARTQTLAAPGAPASNLDAIRQAITLVRTNARSEPSEVVLKPNDAQNIDLLKPNKFAGPGPYGAALHVCGTYRGRDERIQRGNGSRWWLLKAVLFDRLSLPITLGTINDQFIRDMVTVLGEFRAGFDVIRPAGSVRQPWHV
jgi:hypothetical protein